jgi:hypothetical protein
MPAQCRPVIIAATAGGPPPWDDVRRRTGACPLEARGIRFGLEDLRRVSRLVEARSTAYFGLPPEDWDVRKSLLGALGLTILLAAAGCFATPGDGLFGPASGVGALDRESHPALTLKATPARGLAPLPATFELRAHGGNGTALDWTLDFGDGSALVRGEGLPAQVRHTYSKPGSHLVKASIQDEDWEAVSTLSIVALAAKAAQAAEPLDPVQGPAEPPPGYAPPRPQSSSSTGPTSSPGPGNGDQDPPPKGPPQASSSSTTPESPTPSTSSDPSTSTSPPEGPTPSESTTESHAPTPSESPTATSTATGEPTPTEEPTPTPEPTPTEEPTPTPEPTPTEEPTPTPEPTPTEEPTTTPGPTPTPSDPPA